MCKRDAARRCRTEGRLGVLPAGSAGRGVTRVPDGHVTTKGFETRLGKDLRDQPHDFVNDDIAAVTGRDAR